ncbi:hypothetical protein R5R35_008122 [Gryllus longicercus]|uniref:Rho-GAP domain-containing protein n=1 Tax=Gryllus longicercus TaxID=2509291 RepID=A0AAN9Z476_9ORTH
METDVSHEYQEYLNEYFLRETNSLDQYLDEIEESSSRSCDEGEQEAEWLVEAGLPQLSEAFAEGREVADAELEPALRSLPRHQAEAVKRRVRTLNHTLRRRHHAPPPALAHAHARPPRARPRHPDIRDVFKDLENSSTGTRSRSATPDSLDSEQPGDGDIELANSSPPRLWSYPTPTISVVRNVPADRPDSHITTVKEVLRRQPSTSLPNSHAMVFRHPGAWGSHKGSLAGNSAEGIEMLYYQPIGTIHLPRPRDRGRSGSDPTDESSSHHNGHYISNNKGTLNGTNGIHSPGRSKLQKNHITVTRSHSNLYNIDQKESPSLPRVPPTKSALRRSGSHGQLGFEEICQQNTGSKFHLYPTEENNSMKTSGTLKSSVGRTWVEFLGDEDLFRLRPLLLLEVTALFDSYNITFNKRKTPKHKRKDGNVFGVPLAMLLAKDRQITNEECSIPLVFQKVLSHLEKIGVREEGILRVAGLQQKVEALYQAFEADFYRQPDRIEQLLQTVSCHDLAGLLKRLLRDLPQPLLTVEYIDLFYQCHGLPEKGGIQSRALNILVLLLPPENRHTLRALFSFLLAVIQHQSLNKMTLHNVAMIIAPSLFTPRYVHPPDKNDLNAQVSLAATCCRLTETMLKEGDKLWVVPDDLIAQIRRQKEEERYRRGHKENSKPMKKLLGKKSGIREQIMRKIDNEVDFQDGVIRVNAPQFQMPEMPIQLATNTTAGDVVLRIVDEATRRADMSNSGLKVARRYHDKSRALAELAPNGNLSCILASGYPELTLQTHFLYEIGGNIAQRQVEPNANMMAVYKENPNTQWILRCHHRNGNNTTPVN